MDTLFKIEPKIPGFISNSELAKKYDEFTNWPNKPITDDQLDTLEEYFCSKLEDIYTHNDMSTDEFEQIFQMQNFHPFFYGKDIGAGKWVRVQTETGYNVYWAKHSTKRMSVEPFRRAIKKIKLSTADTAMTTEQMKEGIDKLEKVKVLQERLHVAEMVEHWPVELKYVKVMKTKTTFEFLLPHQYEIVDDISLYTAVIRDDMNKGAVKYKAYYSSDNKDQVFYLQTRGIDKDTAVLMCMLQQVYFKVDVQKLFVNYMVPITKES